MGKGQKSTEKVGEERIRTEKEAEGLKRTYSAKDRERRTIMDEVFIKCPTI